MGIRYPMLGAEAHPLIGLPSPDLDLGSARVHELLRSGRGVLLDPADGFAEVTGPWSDRVDRVGQGADTESMLIRPDGYVCWAGRSDDLEPALGRWFGEPCWTDVQAVGRRDAHDRRLVGDGTGRLLHGGAIAAR
ncbi:hypothetical protein ACIRVK_45300 [Streptomyces sp. NPDC101152]|uniref:aromatic-ring hydroxylase C-terminal domain-containing protein n=1 Tax=Streptomyces sp. NPDC101152 TaxID=3366116 RepID=UPI0037F22E0C